MLLACASVARAEDAPAQRPDPRAQVSEQITAELQVLDQTISTVGEKLSAADAQRLRRIRAAYRILRAPLPSDASEAERMASARRRAAARLLIERDTAERTLLADETKQLADAKTVTVSASGKVPALAMPDSLAWPVKGTIARHFGPYEHEKSHAMLTRRGLDIETEKKHESVAASADGVVRYAGPIRGLDDGVIIDHGDYFTVVAKLTDVTIPVGTKVAAGDRLGRAARYRVYFEVRVKVTPGGLPIDPEPLLSE
jgi:septal ring factor EnvC (AmiA/AmiB activator)